MRTAKKWLIAVAALAAGAVACSTQEIPSAPPAGYQISFASIDIAAYTETVQVFVVDATGKRDGICNDLVVRLHSNQFDQVPKLANTQPVTPCDLLAGRAQKVDISLGTRAFVGVGRRANQDYVVGCTVTEVQGGTPEPVIFLDYVNSIVEQAKPTTCQSLSDHCKGAC